MGVGPMIPPNQWRLQMSRCLTNPRVWLSLRWSRSIIGLPSSIRPIVWNSKPSFEFCVWFPRLYIHKYVKLGFHITDFNNWARNAVGQRIEILELVLSTKLESNSCSIFLSVDEEVLKNCLVSLTIKLRHVTWIARLWISVYHLDRCTHQRGADWTWVDRPLIRVKGSHTYWIEWPYLDILLPPYDLLARKRGKSHWIVLSLTPYWLRVDTAPIFHPFIP